jgi:copper chaperone CopZ
MKTIKAIVSAVMILISSQVVSAQTQEIEIKTSAQCMECKENIEGALIDMKGVKFVELDLDNSVVTVAYNSKKVTPDDIRKEITLIGYNADELVADPEAVQRLSPCCRPDGRHLHE